MFEFLLFISCLLSGLLLKDNISDQKKYLLKKSAYYILLAFVVVSLWKYEIPEGAWQLFLLGVLLQLIPSLLGAVQSKSSLSKPFLLFGTYGGGNRGTLALSILSPPLLPIFILIDLGNF